MPKESKTKEDIQEIKDLKVVVMNSLPTQPIRKYLDENSGIEGEILTTEEAITEILMKIRDIHKAV